MLYRLTRHSNVVTDGQHSFYVGGRGVDVGRQIIIIVIWQPWCSYIDT